MQLTYSDNAIVFPDGTKIPYDDGKEKDFVTKLDNSDIEKHGFIWGGRWYHYDTMHFEYRPEFL